ncbi:MBL fold metallo-hydrolase [Halovulum dunhuangense]|uniref:MBL fold metallo-hydrolase n=1 Tax=Halovulum dunhuangense TaxID=1505036 RepID=A0A849L0E2_9RHOB|nr:MBL fold metallo-hydrolase [Halovulum dunhuangense]NNU79734.1 MBL fold metallo-hydrolase [Halovulum dunhuangense]
MFKRLFLTLSLIPGLAAAQDLQSHCIALVENEFSDIRFASFGADLSREQVRISYVDHSMFLIETPEGIGIATDFNGFVGVDVVPDVVTMNNAHSTHWTPTPDPRIPHVLRGWGDENGPAAHRLTLEDEILIRNVTTDIRSGFSGVVPDGNSIFIFEVAGLCIGHLGHLHHEPSEAQYAAIGRLDVVMAAVDGGMTVDIGTMSRIVSRLRSSVVLPMHWFGRSTLERFLAEMSDEFEIELVEGNSTTLSLRDLPRSPTIRVLTPAYFEARN